MELTPSHLKDAMDGFHQKNSLYGGWVALLANSGGNMKRALTRKDVYLLPEEQDEELDQFTKEGREEIERRIKNLGSGSTV